MITDDGTTARFTNVTVVGNDADVTTAVYGAGWANYDGGTPRTRPVDANGIAALVPPAFFALR